MNNGKFVELKEDELYENQGGDILTVLTLVATLIGAGIAAYESAKNDAYNAGKAEAYRDMYGNNMYGNQSL